MNKPAPNEPSMDEILSSIRQIIADDDADPAPRRAPPTAPAEPDPAVDAEPLALTPGQIVRDDPPAPATQPFADDEDSDEEMNRLLGAGDDDDDPPLLDPDDVSFDEDDEEEMPAPAAAAPPPAAPRSPQPRSASPAQAAPLPDPGLTSEMTEELLEPTTQSAVASTLNKLNGLSMVGSGMSLEDLTRQLLRPMLKEWLDENLPAIVERMVEREIERVSRGRR